MKYFKEWFDEESREWKREQITKASAKKILKWHYNNVEQIVETPCYYRTPFCNIEIIEE